MGADHIARVDGRHGDGTTDDRGGEGLPTTADGELDDGVLGTLQCLHNLLRGDGVTDEIRRVSTQDAVARLQACAFAGASLDDTHDDDGIEEGIELHADTRERALEALG